MHNVPETEKEMHMLEITHNPNLSNKMGSGKMKNSFLILSGVQCPSNRSS